MKNAFLSLILGANIIVLSGITGHPASADINGWDNKDIDTITAPLGKEFDSYGPGDYSFHNKIFNVKGDSAFEDYNEVYQIRYFADYKYDFYVDIRVYEKGWGLEVFEGEVSDAHPQLALLLTKYMKSEAFNKYQEFVEKIQENPKLLSNDPTSSNFGGFKKISNCSFLTPVFTLDSYDVGLRHYVKCSTVYFYKNEERTSSTLFYREGEIVKEGEVGIYTSPVTLFGNIIAAEYTVYHNDRPRLNDNMWIYALMEE